MISPALQRGTYLETRLTLVRFQIELEARSLAASGPHSGGIPGCRRRQKDKFIGNGLIRACGASVRYGRFDVPQSASLGPSAGEFLA